MRRAHLGEHAGVPVGLPARQAEAHPGHAGRGRQRAAGLLERSAGPGSGASGMTVVGVPAARRAAVGRRPLARATSQGRSSRPGRRCIDGPTGRDPPARRVPGAGDQPASAWRRWRSRFEHRDGGELADALAVAGQAQRRPPRPRRRRTWPATPCRRRWPSCSAGPATPVTATDTSAPSTPARALGHRDRPPPRRRPGPAGTPSTSNFTSLA